jgi:acetylornithine/N-succinyldiaminopimelate aminotransferase
MTIGVHGTTYGGNPMAMAVANSVLDVILADGFLDNTKKVGGELKSELQNLAQKFPQIIQEIRGVGMMLGVKLSDKIENTEMVKKLIELGLLVIPAGENVIRIMPPLLITSQHVKEAVSKIEAAINNL